MRSNTLTIKLYTAQHAFLDSPAIMRGFCGGVGSAGKSWAGAYDLIKHAKPGRLYAVLAPTYAMLSDATFRSFKALGEQLDAIADVRASAPPSIRLVNGAEVLFRSADQPDSLRGPNLSGIWADEASLMHRDVFDIAIGRLREAGEQGWLTATFTPKGRAHWTYEVFATGRPDTAIFVCKTADNPFLPETFHATTRRQYTSATAAQELDAQFIDAGGLLFQRQWFPIVERLPVLTKCVRAWDLAATVADGKNDPDYTVGALMGRAENGDVFIIDIRRGRWSAQQVRELVRRTAEQDGTAVEIHLEQEPGSAGKIVADSFLRLLAGFNFHAERVTGDKTLRAQPLAGGAEGGLVKMLRGPWNKDALDEIETFPAGTHDDICDALSSGYSKLAASCVWGDLMPQNLDSLMSQMPRDTFPSDRDGFDACLLERDPELDDSSPADESIFDKIGRLGA